MQRIVVIEQVKLLLALWDAQIQELLLGARLEVKGTHEECQKENTIKCLGLKR